MSHWRLRRQLLAGFGVVLAVLTLAGMIASYRMSNGASALSLVADVYLPEVRLATAFERGVLNARIHFIDHVTIQKPGAKEAGWVRFNKAKELAPKLEASVHGSESLAQLRSQTDQLIDDVAAYEVMLRRILDRFRFAWRR